MREQVWLLHSKGGGSGGVPRPQRCILFLTLEKWFYFSPGELGFLSVMWWDCAHYIFKDTVSEVEDKSFLSSIETTFHFVAVLLVPWL